MKSKEPEVMELLNIFIEEYMPHTAGLSENTIRLYKATFRLLLSFLYSANGIVPDRVTFHTLDYPTVTAFLNWLESERHCSIATRNVRLAALSSFAAFAQNHNFDAALIFMTAIKRIPSKKTAVPPRIFFSRDEVSALLRIPDLTTDTGRRDAALLSLMYASGARAQEICDLKVRDILFEGESTKLILTGKGKKTRRIVIAKSSATTLKRYIAWRQIEQKPDCYVFSSQTHEHMTISCVEAIYKKYLQKLKKLYPTMFQEKRYSPHAMRHACAMHMLEAGVPLMAIKNFLGHVSVTTTERYAEFAQSTVDKHIKDWNQRWFKDTATSATSNSEPSSRQSLIPDFLR